MTPPKTDQQGPQTPHPWERTVAVVSTIVIIGMCVYIVLRNEPFADRNLVLIVRSLIALASGAIGWTISGMLTVEVKTKRLRIQSAGAFAMVVLSLLVTPTVLELGGSKSPDGVKLDGPTLVTPVVPPPEVKKQIPAPLPESGSPKAPTTPPAVPLTDASTTPCQKEAIDQMYSLLSVLFPKHQGLVNYLDRTASEKFMARLDCDSTPEQCLMSVTVQGFAFNMFDEQFFIRLKEAFEQNQNVLIDGVAAKVKQCG